MPSRKRSVSAANETPEKGTTDRLTNLVALLLIKGEPQAEQIDTLLRAGYANAEIARLLGLTPNAVNVAAHRLRRRR